MAFPGPVLVATRGADDDRLIDVGAWIAAAARTPLVLRHADGNPADRLPAMADSAKAGLIVLGSRGLAGPRALASVSERVAHRAHCSALVMRAPAANA